MLAIAPQNKLLLFGSRLLSPGIRADSIFDSFLFFFEIAANRKLKVHRVQLNGSKDSVAQGLAQANTEASSTISLRNNKELLKRSATNIHSQLMFKRGDQFPCEQRRSCDLCIVQCSAP